MAAEIQSLDHLAFKIHRAFLNQRGGVKFAVTDLENLGFVDFVTGVNSAKVHFFDQTRRRHINAEGFVLGNQKKLENLIDNKNDSFFIGMKTLAAGKLNPSKAFDYISKHNICSVAIGMVTAQEAEESTKCALERLTQKEIN